MEFLSNWSQNISEGSYNHLRVYAFYIAQEYGRMQRWQAPPDQPGQ